jgi:hypothetical protein
MPIPASLRLSSLSPCSVEKANSDLEPLRVRSPHTLQKMAFDIATLKQSFHNKIKPEETEVKDDDDTEEVDDAVDSPLVSTDNETSELRSVTV